MNNSFPTNDPLWMTAQHMNPDMMLVLIDMVEQWIINEQPEITLMDACFITNNFGVA